MKPSLDLLARPSGTFAMVAMDQRESLRTMFAEQGRPTGDEDMTSFKLAVARTLAPLASAFLIDRHYAYPALVRDRLIPDGCGLILAVDALSQRPGGSVDDASLDEDADVDQARRDGVVALKLLVIWKDDEHRDRRVETAGRFVELCRDAGLLSVLEGVAVPCGGGFDLDAAILDAAAALGPLGPDLYKAQVPRRGRDGLGELVTACEKLDRRLARPWVVLSNGVDAADFPISVEAACRGGASGMLAGRALWRDTLAAADPPAALKEDSVGRLRRLGATVDRYGRPWTDA